VVTAGTHKLSPGVPVRIAETAAGAGDTATP
jgi:hypothetical protein